MSFHFEFVATREDAQASVELEHIPLSVRAFLQQGLLAFKPDEYVRVQATGHLYNNDYDTSNATLRVERVQMRKPIRSDQG